MERVDPVIEELELRVPIRMRRPLQGLLRPLQAVATRGQQLSDLLRAHRKALDRQLRREGARTVRRPSQGRLRIAPGHRVHERLQRRDDAWRRVFDPRAAAAWPARQHDLVDLDARAELVAAHADRRPRQARRALDDRDAALAQRVGLGPRPQARQSFIHHRPQRHELAPDPRFFLGHASVEDHTLIDLSIPDGSLALCSPSRCEQVISARALT